MTRDEHLKWAKERALKYLPDNPVEAMTSMGSDLSKHPGQIHTTWFMQDSGPWSGQFSPAMLMR